MQVFAGRQGLTSVAAEPFFPLAQGLGCAKKRDGQHGSRQAASAPSTFSDEVLSRTFRSCGLPPQRSDPVLCSLTGGSTRLCCGRPGLTFRGRPLLKAPRRAPGQPKNTLEPKTLHPSQPLNSGVAGQPSATQLCQHTCLWCQYGAPKHWHASWGAPCSPRASARQHMAARAAPDGANPAPSAAGT